jgi:transposase-like protein
MQPVKMTPSVNLIYFVERYQKSMPKLSQWAENNIPEGLTVFSMDLCESNRKHLRTSNMIERLNQTVKQRTKVAKIFANEESCLRLVSAIVMGVSEQWVGGRMYLRVK